MKQAIFAFADVYGQDVYRLGLILIGLGGLLFILEAIRRARANRV